MNIYHPAGLVRHAILISTIVLSCYSDNALAQATEIEELRIKVETLKKRVHELESTCSIKAHKVKTKKTAGNAWHSLQVNISKAEVTALLGKPGKIHKWKTGEAWYFPDSKGGEVDFNANENVSGWLEP